VKNASEIANAPATGAFPNIASSLSGLPADRASYFGAGILIHVHVVGLPSMLLDVSENFIFTLAACLPIAVALTYVCTAESKVLILLSGIALRLRTLRHILWHLRFSSSLNCPANPEQPREIRELLVTK